jgi:cell division protein FtsB
MLGIKRPVEDPHETRLQTLDAEVLVLVTEIRKLEADTTTVLSPQRDVASPKARQYQLGMRLEPSAMRLVLGGI